MSNENKGPITDAAVMEKLDKGEELTPEEQEFVKGNPNSDQAPKQAVVEEGEDNPENIKVTKPGAGASDPPKKESDEEDPAKTSAPADKTKQTPEERKKLIDAELDKPESQQDLSQFSESEIGTYLELKKERRKRQKLEEEVEILKTDKLVERLKKDLKPEPAAEPEKDEIAEILDGKADDDILTVAEAKKLTAALRRQATAKAPEKKEEPAKDDAKPKTIRTSEQVKLEMVDADQRLRAKGVDDFREVVDFAADVLKDDDEAREELRQVALAGGNTAERTYYIIKASKHYPAIKKLIEDERAKLKKPAKEVPAEHKDRAKRLEENDGKVKTTGAGTGAASDTGEYSVQEIAAMTIDDIRKLPRETRKAILKKFGSDPNFSK